MKRRRFGFTMIEMLVVLATIVLLVSLLLPSLNGARKAAKTVVCATQLRHHMVAIRNYAQDNTDRLPVPVIWHNWRFKNYTRNDAICTGNNGAPWTGAHEAGYNFAGAPMGLGMTYAHGYLGHEQIYFCPEDQTRLRFPTLKLSAPPSTASTCSYLYNPHAVIIGTTIDRPRYLRVNEFPQDRIALSDGLSLQPAYYSPDWHLQQWNTGYIGGQVITRKDSGNAQNVTFWLDLAVQSGNDFWLSNAFAHLEQLQ